MDYQSLHAKTVVELRKLAKDMKVRLPAGAKKQLIVGLLVEAYDREAAARQSAEERPRIEPEPAAEQAPKASDQPAAPRRRGRPLGSKNARNKAEPRTGGARTKSTAAAETPRPGAAAKPEESAAPKPGTAAKPEESAAPKPAETPQEKPVGAAEDGSSQSAPENPAVPAAEAGQATRPRPFIRRDGADSRPATRGYARPEPRNAADEDRPAQRRGFPFRQSAPRFAPGAAPAGRPSPRPEGQEVRAAYPASRPENPEARAQAQPVQGDEGSRARREGYYNAEYKTSNPAVPEMLAAGECGEGAGVLEIQPDGYGFLRAENCQQGPNDVYISIAQIRRFNLRMGDYVEGKTRPQREGDRYSAILYITKVNGEAPEKAAARPRFEDLVPIYPDQRLKLEQPGKEDLSLRLVDMLAPIGKGQRGMIVSPPKAGKTTLLEKVANAITAGYPDVHLIVLLIDERPEEVTDMKRSIDGEVVYSTFDEMPENHTRVSEMVLERAQRLVEMGRDVVVLMDSITRLARAYNLVIAPTGRSLSGGLDPGALFRPKRFFGAARNIENGGSLTVIATALVETGSRMDDIIYEEFKGTGNMELHLDRKLSDRRVFPAIDMVRSGTRREELLLSEDEQAGALQVRRMLGGGRDQEMAEQIISLMTKTRNNADFFDRLKGWAAVAEKEGYTLGR